MLNLRRATFPTPCYVRQCLGGLKLFKIPQGSGALGVWGFGGDEGFFAWWILAGLHALS